MLSDEPSVNSVVVLRFAPHIRPVWWAVSRFPTSVAFVATGLRRIWGNNYAPQCASTSAALEQDLFAAKPPCRRWEAQTLKITSLRACSARATSGATALLRRWGCKHNLTIIVMGQCAAPSHVKSYSVKGRTAARYLREVDNYCLAANTFAASTLSFDCGTSDREKYASPRKKVTKLVHAHNIVGCWYHSSSCVQKYGKQNYGHA